MSLQELFPVLLFFALLAVLQPAGAQTVYNIQVGAWGDDSSRGNMGVGAEIRTSMFTIAGQDSTDAFWVGSNLQDGAFIQFGYQLVTPGNYCLYGEEVGGHDNCLGSTDTISSNEVRWFWEYWPNAKVIGFYFGTGTFDSAGPDGSWHLYQIWPNVANGWNFVLDGQSVWSFNKFKVEKSSDPAVFVAEEVTSAPYASGVLGPVEFRKLSYLDQNYGWSQVTSLRAISGCGGLNPNCGISIPYGVTVLGPNDIIAGAGEQLRNNGEFLWSKGATLTLLAPPSIHAFVDGVDRGGGSIQVSIEFGSHTISVPSMQQIDNTSRLVFAGWSDGQRLPERSVYVYSDLNLQAYFVRQYLLVTDLGLNRFGLSGSWHDDGSSATFMSPSSAEPMNGLLGLFGGKWVFQGWYENGVLVTSSIGGSIGMNSPHSLVAHWTPNYAQPIAVFAIIGGIIGVILVYIAIPKAQTQDLRPVELPKGYLVEDYRDFRSDSLLFPKAESVRLCRYCGAKIPTGNTKCPECGMTVRYLGAN